MELVIVLIQLAVGVGALASSAVPEPAPPPVQHSPAVNICHPVVYDPETKGTRVDRSVDLCGRDKQSGKAASER